MNVGQYYSYIAEHFTLKPSTNNWHILDCPFCGKKKKGAINFSTERYKCWSCGEGCNLFTFIRNTSDEDLHVLIKTINALPESDIDYAIVEQDIPYKYSSVVSNSVTSFSLPSGYIPIMFGEDRYAKMARNFLRKRGFDLEYLSRLGFGYCKDHSEDFKQELTLG